MDLIRDRLEATIENLWGELELPQDVRQFAAERVKGVSEHLEEIDAHILACSDHWRVERMAVVDRNILRLAIYELIYQTDVPERVIINEAIELGKRFGTEDSGAFINGVLDQIRSSFHHPEARESL
jgi:N utilization substance protein B